MVTRREDLTTLKPGDRVCVVGFGTANTVHRHGVVVSLSRLYVTTEWKNQHGSYKTRHRLDDGHSTPRGDGYGGTTLHLTCQKPRKEN